MNKYNFRVTLTSPAGSLVVVEPQGVQEAPLTLTRNPTFKSVVENFETQLTYVLTAVDFINAAKALGIDTLLTVLIEVSSDFGVTWETFHEGILDLPAISALSNSSEYKIKLGSRKDDVWTKLLSRVDTDVDVQSAVDLDGNAIAAATLLDVTLTTQVIRRVCRMEMWNTTDDDFVDQVYTFAAPTGAWTDYLAAPLDFPKKVFDEFKTKYNYTPNPFKVTGPTIPYSDYGIFELIEADETATKYEIDFSVYLSSDAAYQYRIPANDNLIFPSGNGIRFYYIRLDDAVPFPDASAATIIDAVNLGVDGTDGRTWFFGSFVELDIKKGTRIYILMHYLRTVVPFDAYVVPDDVYGDSSFINIIAHTTFPSSTTKAIRVGEGFDAIIKRITGGDNFYSDFFSIGCGRDFVNMLGLHLRGYNFTAKPFTDNLSERFAAANAIWNIGLGYEKVAGVLKVRIEEAAHFFDSSSNSIDLSYVNNYISTFKTDAINNGVDIGYGKWQLTAGGSLIDDPQTQHTYVPPFKYVGKKISILCSWIAASLMFELTRRAIEKLSETFDTDNDKFVLAIKELRSIFDVLSYEAKVDYFAAANLYDPELRYNKELTPGRNFLRHMPTLFIGAAQYIGNFFKFISGLGNFTASITLFAGDCISVVTVVENQDMEITGAVLHGIEVIKFEGYPLNWDQYKLIRDSPNKSIGISKTNADHVPYFIDNIDFFLFERKANFILFRTV